MVNSNFRALPAISQNTASVPQHVTTEATKSNQTKPIPLATTLLNTAAAQSRDAPGADLSRLKENPNELIAKALPFYHPDLATTEKTAQKMELNPPGSWLLRYSESKKTFYICIKQTEGGIAQVECKELTKLNDTLKKLADDRILDKNSAVPLHSQPANSSAPIQSETVQAKREVPDEPKAKQFRYYHPDVNSRNDAHKKLEGKPDGSWLMWYSHKQEAFVISSKKGGEFSDHLCKELNKNLNDTLHTLELRAFIIKSFSVERVEKEVVVHSAEPHFGVMDSRAANALLNDKPNNSWLVRFSPNQDQWVVSQKKGDGTITHILVGKDLDIPKLKKTFGKKEFLVPEEFSKQVAEKRVRAAGVLKELFKGVAKGAKPMAPLYHPELMHKSHGYGRELAHFYKVWASKETKTSLSFNEWMGELYKGNNVPGKDKIDSKFFGANGVPLLRQVTYLGSTKEREPYRLSVEGGKISNKELGKNYTTPPPPPGKDRTETPTIFVVDPGGNIYCGEYRQGSMNHSSFLAGAPVLSAGELEIKNGVIKGISDKSGHYESSPDMICKGLLALENKGVKLEGVTVTLNSHPLIPKEQRIYRDAAEMLKEYKKNNKIK